MYDPIFLLATCTNCLSQRGYFGTCWSCALIWLFRLIDLDDSIEIFPWCTVEEFVCNQFVFQANDVLVRLFHSTSCYCWQILGFLGVSSRLQAATELVGVGLGLSTAPKQGTENYTEFVKCIYLCFWTLITIIIFRENIYLCDCKKGKWKF